MESIAKNGKFEVLTYVPYKTKIRRYSYVNMVNRRAVCIWDKNGIRYNKNYRND